MPLSSEYRLVARDGRVVWVRDEGVVVRGSGETSPAAGGRAERHHRTQARRGDHAGQRAPLPDDRGNHAGGHLDGGPGRSHDVRERADGGDARRDGGIDGGAAAVGLHSPDGARVHRAAPDERPRGAGLHGEVELRRTDGTPVWAQVSTSPIVEAASTAASSRSSRTSPPGARPTRNAASSRRGCTSTSGWRASGQLAGGIAHDFNNLLAVILTYANFAAARARGQPGRGGHRRDRTAPPSAAAALTRQLLVFSRREMAQPELIDLNEVVAETERCCAARSARTSSSR